jgi:hypothetical protein
MTNPGFRNDGSRQDLWGNLIPPQTTAAESGVFQMSMNEEVQPFEPTHLPAESNDFLPYFPLMDSEYLQMDTNMGNDDGGLDNNQQLADIRQQELHGPTPDQDYHNSVMYNDPTGPVFQSQYPLPEQFEGGNVMYNNAAGRQLQSPYPARSLNPGPAIATQNTPTRSFLASSRIPMMDSQSGPLVASPIYQCPPRHVVLLEEERGQQLLYYVDASKQRPGETSPDYSTRMLRAVENMGLEIRQKPKPAPGAKNRTKEYKAQYERNRYNIKKGETEHRLKLTPGPKYDEKYVRTWRNQKTTRQARNAQRRAAALQRLRNEYESIGLPSLPSPPPVEDSGDELYTFNSKGPIQQPAGNEVATKTASPRTAALRPAALKTAPPLPPPPEGTSYSPIRCAPCAKAKEICSMPHTQRPCERCVRLGKQDQCIPCLNKKRTTPLKIGVGPYPERSSALRLRSVDLVREPCENCQRKSRTCTGNRPCAPCVLWGEAHLCDPSHQDQNYHAEPQMNADYGFKNDFNHGAFATSQGFGNEYLPQQGFTDSQPFSDLRGTFQERNMEYGTAEQQLQASSSIWMGGSSLDASGWPQMGFLNDSEEVYPDVDFEPFGILSPANGGSTMTNTLDNMIDPSAFNQVTNSQLLNYRLAGMQVPPAREDPNDPTSLTGSEVLPRIKRISQGQDRPDVSRMNPNLGCNELTGHFTYPLGTCSATPTMPCDHLDHPDFNICEECRDLQQAHVMVDEIAVISKTKVHMCQNCADKTRTEKKFGIGNDIQEGNCSCVRQLRDTWLCHIHRRAAIEAVKEKSELNAEFLQRSSWSGQTPPCPICWGRPQDNGSGGWMCVACNERVVL